MTYIKDPAEYVGKFVSFYVNTQAGKRSKLRGVVTRVLPSGKLEILVADRGYYEVLPSYQNTENNTDMTREKRAAQTLSRVKILLSKIAENGCSEAKAMAALNQVRDLIKPLTDQ